MKQTLRKFIPSPKVSLVILFICAFLAYHGFVEIPRKSRALENLSQVAENKYKETVEEYESMLQEKEQEIENLQRALKNN